MYELVWEASKTSKAKLTLCRSEWVMITLSAKSFESRRIGLQFKCMRRQVRAQSCLLDGYTNEIQPVSPSGILFSEPESLCPLSWDLG